MRDECCGINHSVPQQFVFPTFWCKPSQLIWVHLCIVLDMKTTFCISSGSKFVLSFAFAILLMWVHLKSKFALFSEQFRPRNQEASVNVGLSCCSKFWSCCVCVSLPMGLTMLWRTIRNQKILVGWDILLRNAGSAITWFQDSFECEAIILVWLLCAGSFLW